MTRQSLRAASLIVVACACGETHARVDVKDAPARDRARALTLDGARIAFDLGGRYDRLCTSSGPPSKGQTGCVDHHFYVFAVVPDDGSRSTPIFAWVTCSGGEKSFDECKAVLERHTGEITGSVAIRVGGGNPPSGWEKAIDDATATHHLEAAPHGPVLRLGRR